MIGRTYFLKMCPHFMRLFNSTKEWGKVGEWGREVGKARLGGMFQTSASSAPYQHTTITQSLRSHAERPAPLRGKVAALYLLVCFPATITSWPKSLPWAINFPVPLVYRLLSSLNLLEGHWERHTSSYGWNCYGFYHSWAQWFSHSNLLSIPRGGKIIKTLEPKEQEPPLGPF